MNVKMKDLISTVEAYNYSNIGLTNGLSGQLLYYYYLNVIDKKNDFQEKITATIEKSVELIENEITPLSYESGMAGFGWVFEYLVQKNVIEADTNEIFEEIDEDVFAWMMDEISKGGHDYLHGATGAGLYFLKRHQSNPSIRDKIEVFVKELISQAIIFEDGSMAWIEKEQKFLFGTKVIETGGRYNLGLAHGIPSILVFLVKVYKQNILADYVKPIITSIVQFILKYQQDFKENGCYFPCSIAVDGTFENYSRLAWCYGDLGMCCALWQANEILQDDVLDNNILTIMLDNATRRDTSQNGVVDACFCHGSSGIAHIFKRFYHRYKHPNLLDAANYWYDFTLKAAVHSDGPGGYKFRTSPELGNWIDSYGLLEGITGIAASLAYWESDQEPTWDEVFLIS